MPARPPSPPPPDHKPAKDVPPPRAPVVEAPAEPHALGALEIGALNTALRDLAAAAKASKEAKAQAMLAGEKADAAEARANHLRKEVVALVVKAGGGDLDDNVVFLSDELGVKARAQAQKMKLGGVADLVRSLVEQN